MAIAGGAPTRTGMIAGPWSHGWWHAEADRDPAPGFRGAT